MAQAHMVPPQDEAGVAMLAAIGPDRKLFDTSLCYNSTAFVCRPNVTMR